MNNDKQLDAQEVRLDFKGELAEQDMHAFFIDADTDMSGTVTMEEYITYAAALNANDEPPTEG